MLVVALLTGLDALEEYFTLVALGWGVPVEAIPLAALAIPLAGAAGTWWVAHRSPTKNAFAAGTLALALGAGGVLLAVSEWFGRPAGLAGVAVFYGIYRVVLVAVNSRLQDAITGPARATVNSVAGLLSELSAIAIYGLWALDGLAPITALILLLAMVMPWALRHGASMNVLQGESGSRGAVALQNVHSIVIHFPARAACRSRSFCRCSTNLVARASSSARNATISSRACSPPARSRCGRRSSSTSAPA